MRLNFKKAAEEIKNNSPENCLIHFKGTKEGLHIFTEWTFTKFKFCRLQWLKLPGVSSEIAHQSLEICGNEVEESDFCKYFYHKYCYRQFTDISKLKRAETKMQRHIDTQEDPSGASVPQAPATPSNPTKRTRSTSTSTTTSTISSLVGKPARNNDVLPNVYILCKREKTYVKDKVCK